MFHRMVERCLPEEVQLVDIRTGLQQRPTGILVACRIQDICVSFLFVYNNNNTINCSFFFGD